ATLGHTGRPRQSDRATTLFYVGANLAAVLRVAAAFAVVQREPLLVAAGSLWVLAFAAFVLRYGPMLVRPRLAS
ncbi:MAG TPA: NnrS family protein, partial [Caulobacter sp.]|nr:NnrS family protein [Caulobacter sp.]